MTQQAAIFFSPFFPFGENVAVATTTGHTMPPLQGSPIERLIDRCLNVNLCIPTPTAQTLHAKGETSQGQKHLFIFVNSF